jgi:hypothetical protein
MQEFLTSGGEPDTVNVGTGSTVSLSVEAVDDRDGDHHGGALLLVSGGARRRLQSAHVE